MFSNTGAKFELTDYDTVVAEKAEKKREIEIAKNLKKKGIDIETISETTGLTIEEIKEL